MQRSCSNHIFVTAASESLQVSASVSVSASACVCVYVCVLRARCVFHVHSVLTLVPPPSTLAAQFDPKAFEIFFNELYLRKAQLGIGSGSKQL